MYLTSLSNIASSDSHSILFTPHILRGASSYERYLGQQTPPEWENPTRQEDQPVPSGREHTVPQQYPDWRHRQELHQDCPAVEEEEEEEQVWAFYKPNHSANQRSQYGKYSKAESNF